MCRYILDFFKETNLHAVNVYMSNPQKFKMFLQIQFYCTMPGSFYNEQCDLVWQTVQETNNQNRNHFLKISSACFGPSHGLIDVMISIL